MASDQKFVDYVCDQASAAGQISSRKMFGEFAVYLEEKVVALICDNQFFLKPTVAGKAMIGEPDEASPFPGAKPFFRISEGLDDAIWLTRLLQATARELPAPKPKKPKPQNFHGSGSKTR